MTEQPDRGSDEGSPTADGRTLQPEGSPDTPADLPVGVDGLATDPPTVSASEDEEADSEDGDREKKRSRPFWVEIPILIVVALAIAVLIKTFLVQAFFIPSGSMEQTLNVNDRILVNKLAFRFDDPNRGDVIVFDSGERRDESILESVRRNVAEAIGLSAPESDLIKRVVGLPGEELEIRDNRVYIDGMPLDEPYLKPGAAMADFGPVIVEVDHYFMMGDNRNLSSDSRFTGTVARDRLVGRAFVIVWPPANWGGL